MRSKVEYHQKIHVEKFRYLMHMKLRLNLVQKRDLLVSMYCKTLK